jgi:putative phosphoesterase
MKIAVISDIHGNDIATRQVLEEAKRNGAELLFVLGDIVGYYYHPEKVLKLFDNWQTIKIQGNHERMMKKAIDDPEENRKIIEKYGHGIEFAKRNLSSSQIKELLSLPLQRDFEIDGLKFKLCHGSPWDPDYYIYPDSPEEIKDRCVVQDIDFVLLGHSHYQFVYKKNDCTIVNVGSVGQPRKGGKANWCIIDTEKKAVNLKETVFNHNELIEETEKYDPQCPYLREVLLRRKDA